VVSGHMLRDGENHLDEVLCVSVAGSEGIPDLVLDTLEPASQCNAANNKEPVKVMVGIKEPTQKAQKTHLKNPLKMFFFGFLWFFIIFNFL
jgi:hypothetical protein